MKKGKIILIPDHHKVRPHVVMDKNKDGLYPVLPITSNANHSGTSKLRLENDDVSSDFTLNENGSFVLLQFAHKQEADLIKGKCVGDIKDSFFTKLKGFLGF